MNFPDISAKNESHSTFILCSKNILMEEKHMRNEIQKMESNVFLRDHMICYLYQSGDPCLVQQAKQLAVQSSKSHVLHIMKANFSCFVPEHKEDLYQCGMVGVLKALVHYNGTRPFHAYSKNYVIHEMSEYTYYLRNIPSAYFARLERKISSTADTLKANGCLLCAEAIAMSSGINIEIVQRELAVMARKQLVYLDSIAGISDSLYSSDVLEEDILLGNIISEQIIEKIQQLPAPLPRILLLKIFYGVTYKEIGERLGIEPGQIYNLYRAGIELLKKQIKKML